MEEIGKFYIHTGDDHWYYYVYGSIEQNPPAGQLKNELASLICYGTVYSDVAVVRSGPLGKAYSEVFTKGELAKTLEFYKTNDRGEVFLERERSRTYRNLGMPKDSGRSFNVFHSFPGGAIGQHAW